VKFLDLLKTDLREKEVHNPQLDEDDATVDDVVFPANGSHCDGVCVASEVTC